MLWLVDGVYHQEFSPGLLDSVRLETHQVESSSLAGARSSLGSHFKAAASAKMFSRETLRLPRSTELMYVR
jgi:hypothetical protein